jgi:hypothetical protein
MFQVYDRMCFHRECVEYLNEHPECWPQNKEEGGKLSMDTNVVINLVGDKQILNVYFDETHQVWTVQVSLVWTGNLKDGAREIVVRDSPILYGSITEYSLLEEPDVWYIGGIYSADSYDAFAEEVVAELLKIGWVWQ